MIFRISKILPILNQPVSNLRTNLRLSTVYNVCEPNIRIQLNDWKCFTPVTRFTVLTELLLVSGDGGSQTSAATWWSDEPPSAGGRETHSSGSANPEDADGNGTGRSATSGGEDAQRHCHQPSPNHHSHCHPAHADACHATTFQSACHCQHLTSWHQTVGKLYWQ